MPSSLQRKDSFSDDMILGLDDYDHWDSDKVTRLQSFDENMTEVYMSDAQSDGHSSDSDSEVDPLDNPLITYPPRQYQRAQPITSFPPFPISDASAQSVRSLLAPDAPHGAHTQSERRRSTKPRISYRELDSDAESDGNGTEDEYRPSPPPRSIKRRGASAPNRSKARSRHAPYPPSSRTSSAYSSPSPSSSALLDNLHVNTRFASRNRLVEAPMPDNIVGESMRCTVEGCGYIQENGRAPDLRRHINTHYRHIRKERWICSGYPEEVADRLGARGLLILEINGVRRRGGCGREFSRGDSLKRHYDNRNIPCSGDIHSSKVKVRQ
ncbi:hypothetical protein NEOLEDRAFT_1243260 [Neolentinus lepideus HHB14362 ss-1]|uniref:Uncharacterized protein n=1 Tax=Neolentinus lepideus HHB14362 ss-1 TaxID=1314782 RepID=A0A165R9A9_9AGAM|nr:hypothetical protein NEOLEDRAFT_1243260 [Neolentinus lepideus HHB14362 ss-1]